MNSDKLNQLSKEIVSPVPFWFLNGPISEQHIAREFEMMAEKGIGDVIVHPRYGLEVEYLSDEWFAIFGWCVREAKKRGMHVWIYDEFNWPSGTAGMKVMGVDEVFQSKYLAVESRPLSEIDPADFEPGDYVVAAKMEGEYVIDTLPVRSPDDLRGLSGSWRVVNSRTKRDPYYIDTLSWEAVNCFKRLTYDEYYARFGEEFGRTIRAIFTDEPSIYWVSVGYDDFNLPYTGDYFSTFEQRFGYDPAPMIPYLFHSGRASASFRADYWDHAGHLFNERYHRNLGEWCREHGIIYTGHNNHEEPLRYQIRYQSNMFDTMRAMDIPGVDHLGKQTLGNSWISVIGHKIASSQAHVSGKARCMSESFGVMEWDTTFSNLKRVTDWQYALGINLLIPHAIYHTISGMTKRESPPSFFYQSPHWEDFDEFGDYVKRLETMLVGGRHVCRVAILYPLTGLWSSYQSDRNTLAFERMENFLNSLCLHLVRNQIEFDLLDFKALMDATAADGHLRIADEDYRYLIVPPSPYLRPEEVTRLTEVVRSGVITTVFYRSVEPLLQNLPERMRGAAFVSSGELDAFVDVLKTGLDPDIKIVGRGADDIVAYRREKDGRKIVFLANRSEKHRKVTALLKNYADAAVFDPETGAYTRLEGRQAGRKMQAQLRFQPYQSYFLVSGMPDAALVRKVKGEPTPIEIQSMSARTAHNVASLYSFLFTRAEGEEAVEVDVRTNPRYAPVNWAPEAPDWTEFAGVYETTITLDFDPAAEGVISMVVDSDFSECEVYVNDTRIEFRPAAGLSREHYLTDFQDVCASVDHLLKRGDNVLRVVSPTKLSEPLRLVGDFLVDMRGKQVALRPGGCPDPYRLEATHPFYSGTTTYEATFELDREYSSLILNLHDVRDSAAVYVNGQLAGKRLWVPYTIDIAPFARLGENDLAIEVRNNMTNLIYGNPRSLGLRNPPTLAGADTASAPAPNLR